MNRAVLSLNLVVIRAKDIDVLGAFYSALGLHFERHRHGKGPEHLAADLGRTVFEIYPLASDAERTTAVRLGFSVPSVDEVVEALSGAGAEVLQQPADSPWGRRAVVRDLEGHKVELTEVRLNS